MFKNCFQHKCLRTAFNTEVERNDGQGKKQKEQEIDIVSNENASSHTTTTDKDISVYYDDEHAYTLDKAIEATHGDHMLGMFLMQNLRLLSLLP